MGIKAIFVNNNFVQLDEYYLFAIILPPPSALMLVVVAYQCSDLLRASHVSQPYSSSFTAL